MNRQKRFSTSCARSRRDALVARYRQWSKGKAAPDNPHGAFIGWAKRFAKNKTPMAL